MGGPPGCAPLLLPLPILLPRLLQTSTTPALPLQVAVRAGGVPPAGEAIAAAEAGEAQGPGRGSRKGRQVAADDRRVQFVQG